MKVTKKEHLIINLFGGPGTGKSTTAAELFALIKKNKKEIEEKRGKFSVELIREFAKDLVYEQSLFQLKNQLYVSAMQQKKLVDLISYFETINSDSIIITDSPLILGINYYDGDNIFLDGLLIHEFLQPNGFKINNLNIFLNRVKEYDPSGRLQTEEEAKKIDREIINLLDNRDIDYQILTADKDVAQNIFKKFIKKD